MCGLGAIRKSKRLDYALTEADHFATLSYQERLRQLEYTESSVKIEDKNQSTVASAPLSQNLKSTLAKKSTTGGGPGRRRQFSSRNSNSTVSQVNVKLKENKAVNIKLEVPITGKAASNNLDSSVIGTHANLFTTLGMGFTEENQVKLFTSSLVQEIQTQVIAALTGNAVMPAPAATNKKTCLTAKGTCMHIYIILASCSGSN